MVLLRQLLSMVLRLALSGTTATGPEAPSTIQMGLLPFLR